jgi:hypothetical protein
MGSLRDRTVTPSFSCDSHKVFLMTIASTSVSVMTMEDFGLVSHVCFFLFLLWYMRNFSTTERRNATTNSVNFIKISDNII